MILAAEKKHKADDSQQNGGFNDSNGHGVSFFSFFKLDQSLYAKLIALFLQAEKPFHKTGGTQDPPTVPNNILFIENLPNETTTMMLQLLFQQYPGFREVRMIEAKPGIAFVEFEDDSESTIAMQALNGFKITPQNPMFVTYAKK